MAQVDLGTRRHRNRTLVELGPQAMTIMQVALRRAQPGLVPVEARLDRPDAPSVVVSAEELPPLLSVPAYLRRHHPEGSSQDGRPDRWAGRPRKFLARVSHTAHRGYDHS